MPQFAYKARRRTGETVSGVLDVPDRSAALAQMERLGLFPIMIDAAGKGGAAAAAVAADARSDKRTGSAFANLLPQSARTALASKRKPNRSSTAARNAALRSSLLRSAQPPRSPNMFSNSKTIAVTERI